MKILDRLKRRKESAVGVPSLLNVALREMRTAFLVLFVFSFFMNVLVLASPLYMMQVYDRVLGSGHVETLIILTVMVGIALLFLGLLDMVRGLFLSEVSTWLERRLGEEMIRASLASTLQGKGTGAQPLRDLGQVRGFLAGPMILPFLDAPWTPLFVGLIWFMHETAWHFGSCMWGCSVRSGGDQ
ncbi:MAG: hypothetical protein HC888_11735 [Candidatus Competibacteraceae bacterium]|nr:hypothetical protein [Candidatus Competibacteraceae bacterium]